jgi:hypothetical protein
MAGRAGSGRAAHGTENPPGFLCDRLRGQTRVSSVRQLPTDHDYAARPANIRLINRQKSDLDRYPLCLQKENNTQHQQQSRINKGIDSSLHVRNSTPITKVRASQ